MALKGTTIKRKTMMEPQLEYIPREFAVNEMNVKLKNEEGESDSSENEPILLPNKDT